MADRRRVVLRLSVLGSAAAVLIVGMLVGFDARTVVTPDRAITRAAVGFTARHDSLASAARAVTQLGAPLVVDIVTAVLILLAGWRRAWVVAASLLVARAVSLGVEQALKAGLERPRPDADRALTRATGASFPSGHATGAAMLWTSITLLTIGWFRLRGGSRGSVGAGTIGVQVLVGAVAVAVCCAVAASRLLLGVHYLSDVVCGLLLGYSATMVSFASVNLLAQRRADGGQALTPDRHG